MKIDWLATVTSSVRQWRKNGGLHLDVCDAVLVQVLQVRNLLLLAVLAKRAVQSGLTYEI